MTAVVLFGNDLLQLRRVRAAGKLAGPHRPVHRVGMDEHVQALHARFPQDLVSAAAKDHAGSLLGKMENDRLLHIVDGILGVRKGGVRKGADALEEEIRGGYILLIVLHHIRIKSAGLDCCLQNIPVIERDPQFLCHLLADGMAACAVFPADGNDLIHGTPPHRSRLLTGPILIVCYHIFCLRAIKFCFRAVFLKFVHFALAFPLFLWYTLVCYEL